MLKEQYCFLQRLNMRISSVNVAISNEDLLGIIREIIDEVLEGKGLEINEVEIDKFINIKGKYSNKVKISFEASLEICDVVNNMIKLKIVNIKVAKFKIFNFIKNFALKKALNSLNKYGIFVDKDFIIVAMDKVEEFIPLAKFNILSINVNNNIKVEVDNIDIDLKSINLKNKDNEDYNYKKENSNNKEDNCNHEGEIYSNKGENFEGKSQEEPIIVDKKKDSYTEFREDFIDKVPNKYEKIAKYAMILPDIVALFMRLFKDERVEKKTKTQLALVISYLASPIDILPDYIPVIGKIDDVAIAFFGLNKLLNDIPENIILENWQGEDDIISIVKEGVYYISNVIGVERVSKLLNFLTPKKKLKNIKENKKIRKLPKIKVKK